MLAVHVDIAGHVPPHTGKRPAHGSRLLVVVLLVVVTVVVELVEDVLEDDVDVEELLVVVEVVGHGEQQLPGSPTPPPARHAVACLMRQRSAPPEV